MAIGIFEALILGGIILSFSKNWKVLGYMMGGFALLLFLCGGFLVG